MGNRKTNIAEGKVEPDKEYLDNLEIDDTIVAHTIHSLLHLRHKQGKLIVSSVTTVTKLHLDNYDWLQDIIERFEAKRKYKINQSVVTEAILWFLMGWQVKA